MITGFDGRVVLSWSSLYIAIVWLAAGMLITLITERRGIYVAILMPLLVSLLPAIFWVNAPSPRIPTFQWFRFGGEISTYWNVAIIPFFMSIVGALIGELIMPSEEE